MITLSIILFKDTQSNSCRFKIALVFHQIKVRISAREIILLKLVNDNIFKKLQKVNRSFLDLLNNLKKSNYPLLIRNISKIKNNTRIPKILFQILIYNINCFSKKLKL